MRWSITELFRFLSARGSEKANQTPIEEDNSPISIRLKPELKHFLRHQSESLDLPVQRVITLILEGVAQASSNGAHERSLLPVQLMRDTINAHSLSGVDVASFLPSITLDCWGNDTLLQQQINNALIAKVSQIFYIREEWLKGDDEYLYNKVRWYKNLTVIVDKALMNHDDRRFLRFIFIRPEGMKMDVQTNEDGAVDYVGLVAEYEIIAHDGTRVTTYELYEQMDWNHWRSREHYKMAIAFCAISRGIVRYIGYELPRDSYDRLINNENFIASELARRKQCAWFPEDLIPEPPNFDWSDEADWKHVTNAMERYYRMQGRI